MRTFEAQAELWWNGLSQRQQEFAFYSILRRLTQAELHDRNSYRGTLYTTFGFGTHMYSLAIDCGYMALHNSIITEDYKDLEIRYENLMVEHGELKRRYEELSDSWQSLAQDIVLENILGED